MGGLKLDPLDNFFSTGSSLIGRMLLFYLAGWVGTLLGGIAATFDDWDDFLDPAGAFGRYSGEDILYFVGWPYTLVLFATVISCFLGLIALVFLLWSLFTFVLNETPSPIHWLALVLITSLVPIAESWDLSISTSLVLLFFWAGLGAAGWWATQAYHPEMVEKAGDLLHGRKPRKAPPPPNRKISPKVWGKPVEGWDGESAAIEDEDEYEDEDEDEDEDNVANDESGDDPRS